MTLKDYWIGMLDRIAGTPSSSTQFSGIKYLADFTYSMPGEAFRGEAGFVMTDLGYAGSDAKMKALKRVYMDEESIKASQTKLTSREEQEFSSVIVNTQAGKKQERSQGHCMAAIIITRNTKRKDNKTLRLSVMYRMTESVRKFGADLLFFQEVLFPAILGEEMAGLTEVTFHFANLSFSPLFFPILLDKVDLVDFLGKLKENPTTHKAILGVIRRDMDHEIGFHAYRTRNVMQTIAHAAYEANPKIKKTMQKIIERG